jgi:hypothetical protein
MCMNTLVEGSSVDIIARDAVDLNVNIMLTLSYYAAVSSTVVL